MYLNVQAQFCWQNTSKTYSKNIWQQKNYFLKTLFPPLEIRIFWIFFCLSQLFRCQVIKDNKSLHTLFSLKGMGKSSFSMLNSDQTHILGQRISWSNHLIYYHSKKVKVEISWTNRDLCYCCIQFITAMGRTFQITTAISWN